MDDDLLGFVFGREFGLLDGLLNVLNGVGARFFLQRIEQFLFGFFGRVTRDLFQFFYLDVVQAFEFFVAPGEFFGEFFIVRQFGVQLPFFLLLFLDHLGQAGFLLGGALLGFGYLAVFLVDDFFVFGLEFDEFLLGLEDLVFFDGFGFHPGFLDDRIGLLAGVADYFGRFTHQASAVEKRYGSHGGRSDDNSSQ